MKKFFYSFMPHKDYVGLYVAEDGTVSAEVKNMETEETSEITVTDCTGVPTKAPRKVLIEQTVHPDHAGKVSKKFAELCLRRVLRVIHAPRHVFRVMKH
ncbi:MAG: hypothetical protein J6N45_03375 [Alphaproteobacteria bacterium]|nr:hypothetical protein [Alphaproteobacteria bacterium]